MSYEMDDDEREYHLGLVERELRETFGHSAADAKGYIKAFYEAALAGQIFPRPWTDDDIAHEGTALAFYIQYHMTGPGKLRVATPQFFDWRSECYAAQNEGKLPPPVPDQDAA
jgi:hypothetical protein